MPRRAPENTLASFWLALAEGAQGIELDVHASADGVIVVHHDATLADGRPVRDVELSALRALSIPSLCEVMDLVNGTAELFVEIKGEEIEALVLDSLGGYSGPAAIHSFNHGAIGRLREFGSPWRLGLLSEDSVEDAASLLAAYGASDFWPHEPLVTPEMVNAVHATGGRVIPWTVNDPTRVRELAALNVDGICADDVSALARALTLI